MSDGTTFNEFPFVGQLPKREKSKLRQVWDLINELSEIAKTEGVLVPATMAAKALNISRQRFHQLIQDRQIRVIVVQGNNYVSEKDLVAFAEVERKNGRPINPPDRWKDCIRASYEYLEENREEARAKAKKNS